MYLWPKTKWIPFAFTAFTPVHACVLAPTEFLSVITKTCHGLRGIHSNMTAVIIHMLYIWKQIAIIQIYTLVNASDSLLLCLCGLRYKKYAVVWLHSILCKKIMWWTQVKRSSTLSPGLVAPQFTLKLPWSLVGPWLRGLFLRCCWLAGFFSRCLHGALADDQEVSQLLVLNLNKTEYLRKKWSDVNFESYIVSVTSNGK